MKRTKRAYYAGLTDGEGYIGLIPFKNSLFYRPRVKISLVKERQSIQIMEELKDNFKGSINFYSHKEENDNRRDAIRWEIADKKRVRRFLLQIMPYLILKKEKAEIALKYMSIPWKNCRLWRGQKKGIYDQKFVNERHKLAKELKQLNKRGT